MSRPLTAADRTPELGDVLDRTGNGTFLGQTQDFTAFVDRVAAGRFGFTTTPEWERDNGERVSGTAPESGGTWGDWVYVSRADGGPVTKEENG